MNTCVYECPDGYYIDLSTRVCVKLLVNFYLKLLFFKEFIMSWLIQLFNFEDFFQIRQTIMTITVSLI